jgi:hypothetical protein
MNVVLNDITEPETQKPQRERRGFSVSVVPRGEIDQGRRMSILIETFDETALLG